MLNYSNGQLITELDYVGSNEQIRERDRLIRGFVFEEESLRRIAGGGVLTIAVADDRGKVVMPYAHPKDFPDWLDMGNDEHWNERCRELLHNPPTGSLVIVFFGQPVGRGVCALTPDLAPGGTC